MRLHVLGALGAVCFHAASALAVCSSGTELVQSFPSAGGDLSAWKLCWQILRMPDALGQPTASETLVLSEATFRPGLGATPVEVLGELRMAEIFVPYDSGAPRFHDLTGEDFELQALSSTECTGTRLGGDRVCVDVQDRELAWRDPEVPLARRGERLVLWSLLNADNYDYVMHYAFWDDGTIEVRAGATGRKLDGADDTEGHTHVFAWRIDLDVAGAGGDHVHVSSQKYAGTSVREKDQPLTKEAGVPWSAAAFTHLTVEDGTRTNGRGRATGFTLSPLRSGLPRFAERWTRYPLAATRSHGPGAEIRAVDLPQYLDKEPLDGENVVLWYLDAHHHEADMRDEDRQAVPIAWVGFRLDPQNLWDGTPFY